MSVISQPYLIHISAISQPYLSHISAISHTTLNLISHQSLKILAKFKISAKSKISDIYRLTVTRFRSSWSWVGVLTINVQGPVVESYQKPSAALPEKSSGFKSGHMEVGGVPMLTLLVFLYSPLSSCSSSTVCTVGSLDRFRSMLWMLQTTQLYR